jgi:GNAT superfamily N-acetyltransferase
MHSEQEPDFVAPEAFDDATAREYFADCLSESGDSHLLVAESNGALIGALKCNVSPLASPLRETRALYVEDIYVVPSSRHSGVGTQLIRAAEKLAGELGIKWIKGRVYEFNDPMQAILHRELWKPLFTYYFKELK